MRRALALGLATAVALALHAVGGRASVAVRAVPSAGGWGWPLDGRPPVVTGFSAPLVRYGAGHRGVDLGAALGQRVLAAGAGVVAFAGPVAGRGVVSVQHRGGLRTTYEPVVPAVRAGDVLARGDTLGVLASSLGHCLPGTCLHWGLRRGASYLDPLPLVDAAGSVRLLRLAPSWPGVFVPPANPARAVASPAPTPAMPVPAAVPDRGPLLARG